MNHLTDSGSAPAEKVTPAKMDAALKAKWVEALRSGEFKQTDSYFEMGGRFCCLGVLCKVAGQPPVTEDGGNWKFVDGVGLEGSSMKLASMNDRGDSFAEIADYIEANL